MTILDQLVECLVAGALDDDEAALRLVGDVLSVGRNIGGGR